jgi:hypothetical protein
MIHSLPQQHFMREFFYLQLCGAAILCESIYVRAECCAHIGRIRHKSCCKK